MLNNFAVDSMSEYSLGINMWYLAIFMTPHYDLKRQEKKQWCFGGWAGGVTNIFVIYLGGGGQVYFSNGIGGGVVKIFAYHMKI